MTEPCMNHAEPVSLVCDLTLWKAISCRFMLTTTPYHAPICERAKSAGSWHVDHLLKVFVESIKKRRHSLLLAQGRNPFNLTNYVLFFFDKKPDSFHVVPTAGRFHSSPFPKPHRRVLWYTSCPVEEGGGGWGVGVKPGIDGDSNHSHPQPLSFTIIIRPRL